ncbi:hypothetical protein K525DRAFT_275825, partial [Schizophyllum commune Loenen D]
KEGANCTSLVAFAIPIAPHTPTRISPLFFAPVTFRIAFLAFLLAHYSLFPSSALPHLHPPPPPSLPAFVLFPSPTTLHYLFV